MEDEIDLLPLNQLYNYKKTYLIVKKKNIKKQTLKTLQHHLLDTYFSIV
jgi:hypothetical protein